jgi:hypothetical protein
MTSIASHKITTVLVAALAAVLVGSTVAIGSGHMALADNGKTTKVIKNKGTNVPTETQQNQECETAGGTSGVSSSCTASSTNTITPSPTPTTELLTFVECSGTNGNHNVHCTVHDSGITDINCLVANPAISGGNNVGDCLTNNGVHLTCVIPPQPGLFPCTRQ